MVIVIYKPDIPLPESCVSDFHTYCNLSTFPDIERKPHMYHLNQVKVDRSVRKKTAEYLPEINQGGTEMSMFDSAFICGLLQQFRPGKIVEIGVSAGGTTAIILQCMHDLGITFEMHSVDLLTYAYRNKEKPAGWIGELAREHLGIKNHSLYTGGTFADYVDQIGGDIDFLVLDTTHSLPGEVLEFLAVFPYLKKDAVVVMHDIRQNHVGSRKYLPSFATTALFSSVVADKYINEDEKRSHSYPNIGAFQITEDTGKYITDVAGALMLSWNYIPDPPILTSYMQLIEKNYSQDICWLVQRAIDLNLDTNRQIKEEEERKRSQKNVWQRLFHRASK